ncbi:alpha-L-fucosidase [Parabacteroides sp. FAFU027]|uniref:alpha-L-fucosidase n=1 Tax=Parabacteroides sp. FAFU027 TaxID=2922715 RepID=UPI001FAF186C|nr:alpha-L-fucosidase [Parabacteroides sp. FAFU027]
MKQLILSSLIAFFLLSQTLLAQENNQVIVNTNLEPVQSGQYEPTWQSLSKYKVPEWYRNAKFGIWAHWGPQCQAEHGDWYARGMYGQNDWHGNYHLEHYGHPSKFGFKDIIHEWKAENWNPEKLVKLYKETGAQYFFAMANHHDNLDLWDSKYQEWNSVRVGPQKDIMTGWANAARKYKLPFGISVHASHAWTFYEPAQGADTSGVYKGVPYDGKLTKADGKGTWWEGLDPQELYAQNHALSKGWGWEWQKWVTPPSQEYCDKFYNRTMDLINKYNPDLVYFDDTALPLYPVSDAGLKIAAHYYNHNMATHHGKLEAVLFGKILSEEQKKCMVWDVERGAPDKGQELAWQTCTCIGDWHYNRGRYNDNSYKSAATVIRTLIDIVSKNGNLLLNIPVRGDGTIDDREVAVLEGIAKWMKINSESIFDTRPWKVFGEGPAVEAINPMKEQGFNEGKVILTAKDIRYNQKKNVLYASLLGVPTDDVCMKLLGKNKLKERIKSIRLLGSSEKLVWKQNADSLVIQKPEFIPNDISVVFVIQKEPLRNE